MTLREAKRILYARLIAMRIKGKGESKFAEALETILRELT